MRDSKDDDAIDPSSFAAVLSQVFRGESWDDIEPYAARAWSQLPTKLLWDEVRERVYRTFGTEQDAAL